METNGIIAKNDEKESRSNHYYVRRKYLRLNNANSR